MSDGRCEFRFQPSGNRCQKPIHPGEESHLWQLAVNESLAQQGMNVDHDPAKSLLKPLPPSEKAELQASLLNEIGLTLTAVAKEQVAQGVSMVTAFASHTQRLQNIADDRDRDHQLYRQMDERIQGLLVELEQGLDQGTKENDEKVSKLLAREDERWDGLATRLAQIEERLENVIGAEGTQISALLTITNLRLKALELARKPRKAGKRKRVKR